MASALSLNFKVCQDLAGHSLNNIFDKDLQADLQAGLK